jgi:hypothetical protein
MFGMAFSVSFTLLLLDMNEYLYVLYGWEYGVFLLLFVSLCHFNLFQSFRIRLFTLYTMNTYKLQSSCYYRAVVYFTFWGTL